MTDSHKRIRKNCICISILLLAGAGLALYLVLSGYEPSGGDIWGHLYKSQEMYESLKKGNVFPLFSPYWYNGIQLFRYWGPLSYYIMAGLMFLTGGDLLLAYRLIAFVIFVVGGLPWILWGIHENRRVLGTFFGVLWFFMPEHIRIYFTAGNLPQMVTTMLVPYVIWFLWLYVRKKNNRAAVGLFVCMTLMSFTHLMVTAIMGVSAFLYLLIDQIWNKDTRRKIFALIYMLCGILAAGIWVLPSLKGGLVTSESGDGSVMSTLIYPLTTSLNPFKRLSAGNDSFYFGLAAVLIAIAGILLARGGKKAGFVFLLIMLACTTPAAYKILVKLPFSQLFWMTRFAPMVYGFFFSACLEWVRLKKKYCVLLAALLCVDSISCMNLDFYSVATSDETKMEMQQLAELTDQRTAVIDKSSYGSYPSYGISGSSHTMYTYGWAWQGAETGDNIVLLNEALDRKYYRFLFDRAVELGTDTVLIRKIDLEKQGITISDIEQDAAASGYSMVQETTTAYIYKRETPENFGTVTGYYGLAIGKYANEMTLLYPAFVAGSSDVIEDYSVEELRRYDTLFLTGFEYRNQSKAEAILTDVAAAGTRVVIDSTHVPANKSNKQEMFLGVFAQQIHFDERYPVLSYQNREIRSDDFAEEDRDFSTAYITGTDTDIGTFQMGEQKLTFLGMKDDLPNVYFLGLNLMYEAVNRKDAALTDILNDVLGISNEQLPDRELVPITILYTEDGLSIDVDADFDQETGVNTSIAAQDIFTSDQEISEQMNLLVVHEKHTEISFVYPMFIPGIIITISGFICFILCICMDVRDRRKPVVKQTGQESIAG